MTEIVNANVKVIPAKRKASYDVPLAADAPKKKLVANVGTRNVTLVGQTGEYPVRSVTIPIPRTLEAVDNVIALLEAVRAELVEQGIVE